MTGFGSYLCNICSVFPRLERHEIVHFTIADFRLANDGLLEELQRLRYQVNFKALKYRAPADQGNGKKDCRDFMAKKFFLSSSWMCWLSLAVPKVALRKRS